MAYSGEIDRGLIHPSAEFAGGDIRLPVTQVLAGILSAEQSTVFTNKVLQPILEIASDVYVRGSQIPLSFLRPESGVGGQVRGDEITNFMEGLDKALPQIFETLGIGGFMFKKNIDVNIEVHSAVQMQEMEKLLQQLTGVRPNRFRSFLSQVMSPEFPGVVINIVNPHPENQAQISPFSRRLNDDVIGHYYGANTDRRFAISAKLDAARAYVSVDPHAEGSVICTVRSVDAQSLFKLDIPDVFLLDQWRHSGQTLADLARQQRFLGSIFGTEAAQLAMKQAENTQNVKMYLEQRLAYEHDEWVADAFDRQTIIGNTLVLFLTNPQAFATFQNERPYTFLASRMYNPFTLSKEDIFNISCSVSQRNIDAIVKTMRNTGLMHKGLDGGSPENNFTPISKVDDVVTEIIGSISQKMGKSERALNRLICVAVEKSGTTYRVATLRSLLTLLTIFDPWNPVTKKPFSYDPELLYEKLSVPVIIPHRTEMYAS